MDFKLTQEQYSALVALARSGIPVDGRLALEEFLKDIEKSNGATRYLLWVQWQEADQPLPPTVQFPDKWPPELRKLIERIDRPIAKADVDAVLAANASKPVNVLVTKDPAGRVGWTQEAVFFTP